ncbi:AAA family ATPase [Arsenicitalea aurantiaca]|uniref:AAA family ATPase n=1 Tax=Arsenicitalea aurantiaca TaxID=1783274 RepID=UPI00131533CC|nr:AAA family ATPase [Arsenicitalea aurantiaca]
MSGTDERREPDQLDGVPLPEHQPHLFGHAGPLAAIREQITAGRLPGAILLHGPQGIGKATLAFRIARDILTATGDEDAHRVDEQVIADAHPNLFVLRKQLKDARSFYTVIRVDEIRDLRERMRRTRGRAGHRIAIIDSIDDCNPSAANALLKTLEEPPADTVFLLVSHRPGTLLPTIRSRCHVVALRPLPDEDVRAVLSANGGASDSAQIGEAVKLASGRPRRGFEALMLGGEGVLPVLSGWLDNPLMTPAAHMAIADAIAADKAGAEAGFARELILAALAREAREAAIAGPAQRSRLASANELWDKAHALFAEADSLNLDARQTLTAVLDAIRSHAELHAPPIERP